MLSQLSYIPTKVCAFAQGNSLPDSRGPRHFRGGDDGIRTHDPHVANVMLSQLSYIPTKVCAFAQGNSLPDFETIVNRFA